MKLFCCSDLHSFYTATKEALDAAGFDPNNEEHWLIVCGDCFDRGDESEQLFQYIMSLERKILVKGNHDLLLEDLCMREFPYSHDFSNGTAKTVYDLGSSPAFDECCRKTWDRLAAYRATLVNCFETENYIFVHSWIPTTIHDTDTLNKHYKYREDWRNAVTQEWEEAMWGNPFFKAQEGMNKTGKTIVFGHWHCSAGWSKTEGRSEFDRDARWDIYHNAEQGIIAIDRCTAYTGKVNVLVLEDNFLNKEGI